MSLRIRPRFKRLHTYICQVDCAACRCALLFTLSALHVCYYKVLSGTAPLNLRCHSAWPYCMIHSKGLTLQKAYSMSII